VLKIGQVMCARSVLPSGDSECIGLHHILTSTHSQTVSSSSYDFGLYLWPSPSNFRLPRWCQVKPTCK